MRKTQPTADDPRSEPGHSRENVQLAPPREHDAPPPPRAEPSPDGDPRGLDEGPVRDGEDP